MGHLAEMYKTTVLGSKDGKDIVSKNGVVIAYRYRDWKVLSQGHALVSRDHTWQFFGNRSILWGRFQHKASGKTVFVVNYHGATYVESGGECGHEATAYNMLRVMAQNAH